MTETKTLDSVRPAIALEHLQHVWTDVALYLHDKGYEWAGLVRGSTPVGVQDHRIQIECASEAATRASASDHRSDAIGRALLVCLKEAYGEMVEPEQCWELSFTSRDQGRSDLP